MVTRQRPPSAAARLAVALAVLAIVGALVVVALPGSRAPSPEPVQVSRADVSDGAFEYSRHELLILLTNRWAKLEQFHGLQPW